MSATKETANRELSISRLINAPIELVWEAWTNPEHIKHWWGPEGFKSTISKMEVHKDGEWEFIMHGPDGTDYKNKHIYLELDKPTKIVMKHISFPPFVMTARFEAQGNKTLVSLHSVFESAEQLAEVIKVFKADEGMKQNIARMDSYIAQINTPVVVERIYNAPVEKVWKALTRSEEMKQWYFDIPAFNPVPGFEFQFYGEGKAGEKFLHLCKITDVIENKLLRHSWRYDGYEGISIVTFELSDENGGTKLRLTHEGLGSFPKTANDDFAPGNFEEGWNYITGISLTDFLEK